MDKPSENSADTSSSQREVFPDQDREWAQQAQISFEKGNYALCIQFLNKLEASRPHDIKVSLNKVIAEFFKTDMKKIDQLKKSLSQLCSQASTASEKSNYDNTDNSLLLYNYAVLLYHLKQYQASIGIVSKVFGLLEHLDEHLAWRIGLLLVELHLCQLKPNQALNLIQQLEMQLLQPALTLAKSLEIMDQDVKEKIPIKQIEEPQNAASNLISGVVGGESFKLHLYQLKVKAYLMLRLQKQAKTELKNLNGTATLSTHYLSAFVEYQYGNLTQSAKLLNLSPCSKNPKESRDYVQILLRNNLGNICMQLGKYNLACLHYHKALQQSQTNSAQIAKPESGEVIPSYHLHLVRSLHQHEIINNLGLAYLFARKPTKAFDCFLEVIQFSHNNPRIWLRLAECCILAHQKDSLENFKLEDCLRKTVKGVVGSQIHRKIVLTEKLSNGRKDGCDSHISAVPVVSLEFGSLCLKNALHLIPSERHHVPPVTLIGNNANISEEKDFLESDPVQENIQSSPSDPMRWSEVLELKATILLSLSYVSLCLGDYNMALEYSQQLLNIPDLSPVNWCLSNLYAAEALVFLNRLNEAMERLHPKNVRDLNQTAMFGGDKSFDPLNSGQIILGSNPADESQKRFDEHHKNVYPVSTHTMQVLFQYNLAVALILQGNLEKAGELLRWIWTSKGPDLVVPVHVIMLALYIQIKSGHIEIAVSIIKQHCPQYK